jgi:hypothetical protein
MNGDWRTGCSPDRGRAAIMIEVGMGKVDKPQILLFQAGNCCKDSALFASDSGIDQDQRFFALYQVGHRHEQADPVHLNRIVSHMAQILGFLYRSNQLGRFLFGHFSQ